MNGAIIAKHCSSIFLHDELSRRHTRPESPALGELASTEYINNKYIIKDPHLAQWGVAPQMGYVHTGTDQMQHGTAVYMVPMATMNGQDAWGQQAYAQAYYPQAYYG